MNNLVFFMLLMLCMAFHYMPVSWHEVMGVMLVLPFARHIYSCRGWWKMLGRGRTASSGLGLFSSLLNVLLLASFAVVIASGVLVSGYLFREIIPLELRMNITLHQLHVSACYWFMLLAAVHTGLHYESIRRRLWGTIRRWQEYALAAVVLLLGIFGSVSNQLGSRLMMKHVFHTDALQLPGMLYFLLLLGIFGMYFLAGSMVRQLAAGRFRKGAIKMQQIWQK